MNHVVINKISEIDKKMSQIDNKFTYNIRFMIESLLKFVNKISEIDKKITRIDKKMISNNTICIINIKKDKSKCVESIFTMVYFKKENEHINNNNWARKKTVEIFWKNNTISEICEKWILYCNNNYAYIRSEKLHTHLGELLCTREHKEGLSKKKKKKIMCLHGY